MNSMHRFKPRRLTTRRVTMAGLHFLYQEARKKVGLIDKVGL